MSNKWSWPLVVSLLVGQPLWAGDAAWEPEKTWVFAVGALQFDDPHLTAYPDQGRVDAVLMETFRKRGVPEERIVFIKNKDATKANITGKLAAFLTKPGKDDTLFFYYTGHGGRDYADLARPVSFVTYDTKSTWSVSSMFDAIEEHFQGSKALLTADCCHSGALAEEASRRSGRISYGVLTSSQVASVSTNNWTFTQCLADLFAGSPMVDLNCDGVIGFEEAGHYCDAEMSFCEDQRASQVALGGFAKDMVLAKTAGKVLPRVGERCEGENRGVWMKAKILEVKDDKCLVDWVGRGKLADAWLSADRIRKYEPEVLEAGTPVEVEWNAVWYAGKVRQTHLGLHLVHYEGFPAADDEWVPMRRLRARPK